MKRTNVLFVSNTYPYWTGTDAGGLALIRAMARRGARVTVIQTWSANLEPYLERIEGLTAVRALGPDCLFDHLSIRDWIRLFRKHASDVCVLNKGYFLMRHEGVDLAARLSSKRYVAMECHPATAPNEDPVRGKRWLKRQVALRLHYSALHEVVTDSVAVRTRLRKWYGLPRNKGVVVPFGIDTEKHAFDAAGRRRIRARFGASDGTFLLGSVGRLAPEKGWDRLLPVFARLVAEMPGRDIRLVVAGEGGESQRLQNDSVRLGISGRVVFPGWIDEADRVAFLSALDCFTLPSRAEGQGLALLEAMACERPVIATACGGADDILTTSDMGWLVPNDDTLDGFGVAIREVLALTADRRCATGARARRHVQVNFDAVKQSDRQVDALLGPFH